MELPNDVARCPGTGCQSAMNCRRYTERAAIDDRTPMAALHLRREAGADACDQVIPVQRVSTFEAEA